MLQFNFKLAHIADSVKTIADVFSGVDFKMTEKIRLEVREDMQTTPIVPRMSQTKNLSSHKQIMKMKQRNRPVSVEKNIGRMRQNGKQTRKHA